MAWARIDDGWWCHPKVLGLTLEARGLWATALSWSCAQRRDIVPTAFVDMVAGHDGDVLVKELEDAELWHPHPKGWQMHDWAEYQGAQQDASDSGSYGNHVRWHVNRDVVDDECDHCAADRPDIAPESPPTIAPISDQASPPIAPVPSHPNPKDQTLPSTDVDREAAETGPDDAADEPDPAAETFEQFWKIYPARHGKKLGKGNALIEWRKLTMDERRRAYRGAQHLAASDSLPKDAERFLRRAKGGKGDFPFDDWQEPAESEREPEFVGGVRVE